MKIHTPKPSIFSRNSDRLFKLLSLTGLLLFSPALTKVALADFTSVNKSFSPRTILPGDTSKLTITIYNAANRPLTGVNLTDDMAAGGSSIKVASPPNVVNTCGGTIAAPSGSSTISLTGGGVNAAIAGTPQSCSITVDVTSTTAGTQINTIPANAITNNENDTNGQSAADNLQVTALKPLTVSNTFSPTTILAGLNSTYTVRINNPNVALPLNNVALNPVLPNGLTLAGTPTASNCGSGTFSGTSFSGGTLPAAPNNSTAATCTLTYPVTSTSPGNYVAAIVPSAVTTDRGVTNTANSGNATLSVQQSGGTSSVTLGKRFSSLAEGGVATLDITITNQNIFDLTNVSVSDTLPTGMTVASPSGITTTCSGTPAPILTAVPNTTLVSMTRGTVPKGVAGPGTCTISVRVTTNQPSGTSLPNTIPAGNLTSNEGLTNTTAANATATVAPALIVGKALAPTSIPLNGRSVLTLTIRNNAARNATGVSITDSFPAGLTLFNPVGATLSPDCGSGTLSSPLPGATSIQLTGATIGSGRTCTVTIAVTSAATGVYTNTIPANSLTSSEGWTEKNVRSAAVTVRSGLTVRKRFSPDTVTPGTPTLLIVTLENETLTDITGTTVTDPLTNSIVASTNPRPSTNCTNGSATLVGTTFKVTNATVPAQVGSIPGTCTFQAYVVSSTSGRRDNTIVARTSTSNEGYTNIEAATASFTVQNMDLGITKGFTPTDKIDGGDPVNLVLTLTNGNNVALTNATFTDNMPTGMQVFSTPSPSTTCTGGTITATPGSGSFNFSGGTIPANGNCTVTLQITSVRSGNLTNTIPSRQVITDQGATNPNPASKSLTVLPAVAINKSFAPTAIDQGQTSVLTLTLLNSNTSDLNNAVFTDTFPSGMVVDNTPGIINGCGGTVTAAANSGFIRLTNGVILATSTCQITVTVKATQAGRLTNTIPVGGLVTGPGLQNKKPAIATIDVTAVVANDPNLILLKRITKINNTTTGKNAVGNPIDLTQIAAQPDVVGTPRDESTDPTNPNWPSANYPQGATDAGVIKTGDTIEYTIYFLSNGGKPVTNANLCDWVPGNTVFQPNSYGTDQGIQLAIGSTINTLSNVPDGDRGTFFNSGSALPATYPSGSTSLLTCRTPAGSEGAVVVNLVNNALTAPNNQLPNATAAGTPGNSYGFIRFVSKVK